MIICLFDTARANMAAAPRRGGKPNGSQPPRARRYVRARIDESCHGRFPRPNTSPITP